MLTLHNQMHTIIVSQTEEQKTIPLTKHIPYPPWQLYSV